MGFFHFHFLTVGYMLTDTTFRKFYIEFFYKKAVVCRISKHWPYHTDLLVVRLKFRYSPVSGYLNYYYNITNDYWAISEQVQVGK